MAIVPPQVLTTKNVSRDCQTPLRNSLSKLSLLVKLSRSAEPVAKVRENLGWAAEEEMMITSYSLRTSYSTGLVISPANSSVIMFPEIVTNENPEEALTI